MAVLNWHFAGQPPATAQAALASLGPRVQIQADVHPAVQKSLADANLPIPASVGGLALIDTGATTSAIDIVAASQLELKSVGRKPILTPAGSSEADQFVFTIRLLPWGTTLNCVPGLGASLKEQGIIALIGMDILSQCVLTVNGPGGFFFLSH